MSKKDEELSLEEQVERIRKKRQRFGQYDSLRNYLNGIFLVLAAIGLVVYYTSDEHKLLGLGIIGVGMVLKVLELFIRFVL